MWHAPQKLDKTTQQEGDIMSNKHAVELKKEVIKYHLSSQGNFSQTASHFNLAINTVRLWVKTYEYHGEIMFETPAVDVFSPERKLKIIKDYQTTRLSIIEFAAKYQLGSDTLVKAWLKAYQLNGKKGLIDNRTYNGKYYQNYMKKQKYRRDSGKPVAQMAHDELMETLTYLRAENAYLKKLEELAQKKRQMPQLAEKKAGK